MLRACEIAAVVFCACQVLAEAFPAYELKSGSLSVRFSDDGRIVGLSGKDGVEFVERAANEALLSLDMVKTNDFTCRRIGVRPDADGCRCVADSGRLQLVFGRFTDASVDSATCSFRVVGDELRLGLDVRPAPGWALEEASFPRIPLKTALGGDIRDDRLVLGSAKGGVWHAPGAKKVGWQAQALQPYSLAAQFAAVYDQHAGLFFSAMDDEGWTKRFVCTRTETSLLLYAIRIGFSPEGSLGKYEYALAAESRMPDDPLTWQDFADRYRRWAERQRWCRRRLSEREDLPGWLRDAPVLVRYFPEWVARPELIRRWQYEVFDRRFRGVPLIAALWGWEKHGTWIGPDYFPVVGGDASFSELLAELRKGGAHAFLWPSGYWWTLKFGKRSDGRYQWDDEERFMRVGAEHAVLRRDGKVQKVHRSWLQDGENACLCGGDAWTRTYFDSQVLLPLMRLGCELVQMDQMVGGAFPECWSTRHGHVPNEGRWKADAMRGHLSSMTEQAKRMEMPLQLSLEEPNEHFIDSVALQDYRSCDTSADEWASVFNYVYHEYLSCFPSTLQRFNRRRLVHAVVDGQMPFLIPNELDVGIDRQPVRNGSFEQDDLTMNSGLEGWSLGKGTKGGKVVVKTNAPSPDGGKHVRLEVGSSDGACGIRQGVWLDDQLFRQGRQYRLSAWVCRDFGLSEPALTARFCSLTGEVVPGELLKAEMPETTGVWARVGFVFRVPCGADRLDLSFEQSGTGASRLDGVCIQGISDTGELVGLKPEGEGSYLEFMRMWIELYRGRGRKFLAVGRPVKPPAIESDGEVFVSAYQSADGERAVVLGNPSPFERTATIRQKGKTCHRRLRGGEICLLAWRGNECL